MTKLEITKAVTSTIVGIGAGTIVRAVSLTHTPQESVADKVTVTAGSVVLGMMAADVCKQYTDAKIDALAAWWNANVTN